jgi:hypothetical protein
MSRFVCAVLGLVSFLIPASSYAAPCEVDGADAAALRATWDAVDGQCPCGEARRTYVACASAVVKDAVATGALPASCRKVARKRAAQSTCGRPGARVCCRTMANGTVKGRVVGDASRCKAPSGGQACLADRDNVVDGCSAAGCVACGNGLVEYGEACEPPGVGTCSATCQVTALCGNGVIDVGEDCEPPGSAGCTDACTLGTCAAPPAGETTIACETTDFTSLAVAAGGDGYLAGWGGHVTSTNQVVRVRRLDAAAQPVDALPSTLTDPNDGLYEGTPYLVGDAAGWFAAWNASAYPLWSISGVRVDASGSTSGQHLLAQGSSFGMCQSGTSGPSGVTSEGTSQYAVLLTDWAGCLPSFVFYGHRAIRVAVSGSVVTTTLLGSPDPLIIPPPPSVLSDASGGLAHDGADTVMVLAQTYVDPDTGTVIDRALNAHWMPTGSGTTRLSSSETVRSLSAGGSATQFLVAWAGTPLTLGTASTVRALRFTRAAGALDPDGGIVLASGVSVLTVPQVAFDGSTWLVTWLDGTDAGPWSIRGVRLQPDGTVVDATPRLLASGVVRSSPSITSRGSGWLLGFARPAGPGLTALNVMQVTP